MGFRDELGLYGRPGRYIMMKETKIRVIVWAYLHLRDWDTVKEIMTKETHYHMKISAQDVFFVRKHIRITPELKRTLLTHRAFEERLTHMRRKYPSYFGNLKKHRLFLSEYLNSDD